MESPPSIEVRGRSKADRAPVMVPNGTEKLTCDLVEAEYTGSFEIIAAEFWSVFEGSGPTSLMKSRM